MASIKIDLPKWEEYSSASAEDKATWDTWVVSLKAHEADHVTIGKNYLSSLQTAIAKDIGTRSTAVGSDESTAMAAAAKGIVLANYNNLVKQAQGRQNELDNVTSHGSKPLPKGFKLGPL